TATSSYRYERGVGKARVKHVNRLLVIHNPETQRGQKRVTRPAGQPVTKNTLRAPKRNYDGNRTPCRNSRAGLLPHIHISHPQYPAKNPTTNKERKAKKRKPLPRKVGLVVIDVEASVANHKAERQ